MARKKLANVKVHVAVTVEDAAASYGDAKVVELSVTRARPASVDTLAGVVEREIREAMSYATDTASWYAIQRKPQEAEEEA